MKTTQAGSNLAALFKQENLALPPIPEVLRDVLRQTGPNAWSTRGAVLPFDALERHISEARANGDDYAEVGFLGHGINSWQLCCNIVHGPMALFLQCRWGNAYDDAERARRRIQGVMGLATRLEQDLAKLAPTGDRLIVCFSDHFPSRWQWTREGGNWHQDGDFTLLAAIKNVQDRLKAQDKH